MKKFANQATAVNALGFFLENLNLFDTGSEESPVSRILNCANGIHVDFDRRDCAEGS